MLHVDDVLFVGTRSFWEKEFLPELREKFTISSNALEDGGSIFFLKRKLVKVERGLALVPGANIDKLVENFEGHFGPVRVNMWHVMLQCNFQMFHQV